MTQAAAAIAEAEKQAKGMNADQIMVICVSGRGDKDMATYAEKLEGLS